MDSLLKAAASGCDGYVHSGISGSTLAKVIRNLGNDICIFDRTVIDKLLHLGTNRLRKERRTREAENLSPRERKIAELLADGKTNAAIGKELELAAGTVKNIISAMMKRHHFQRRTQLVNMLSS